MDHAKQSLAQFLFHQAGDVPADLATAIALVNDEIVPVLMIQRRAGQALPTVACLPTYATIVLAT